MSMIAPALLLPHQITSEGQIIAEISKRQMLDKDDCWIFLKAKTSLSPSSSSTTISVRFEIEDHTKIKASLAGTGKYCLFDCPLSNNPFVCAFTAEASGFRPFKIENNNCPVKRRSLDYFEQELNCFIGEIARSLSIQYSIDIEATAFIKRDVWYKEAMEIMAEIESEGVIKESSEVDDGCSDCPVCLDVVQMRWLDGLRLQCMHVFHFNCIASWFKLNGSCPVCAPKVYF